MTTDVEANVNISREELKTMFYMLSGKPDSIMQVFDQPISLVLQDLKELHRNILEKLRQYNVEAVTTTVVQSFSDGVVREYGNWDGFIQSPLDGPEVTEALSIRWDMLLRLPEFRVPQRHTLMLRATARVKPSQVLQYMLTGEDVEKMDYEMAPIFCRVDFVNHLLSQELVNIVAKWYQARPKPIIFSSAYYKLREHRSTLARIIHYSIPVLTSILCASVLLEVKPAAGLPAVLTYGDMRLFMLWLLTSLVLLFIAEKTGHRLASHAYGALRDFGDFRIFRLTRGDANKQTEVEQKNNDYVRDFLWNLGISAVIDIVVTVASALLLGQ